MLPSTGTGAVAGAALSLPAAKAGTPATTKAAHASHGAYFFVNPIQTLSPSMKPVRPKAISGSHTSQRLLCVRRAKLSSRPVGVAHAEPAPAQRGDDDADAVALRAP